MNVIKLVSSVNFMQLINFTSLEEFYWAKESVIEF